MTGEAMLKAKSRTTKAPETNGHLKKASWWVPAKLWEDFRTGCFVLKCSQGEVLRELISAWLDKNQKKIEDAKKHL